MKLYTIGHSAHPIEKFITLLKNHQIQILVDIRSTPVSRWHPQFNRNALRRAVDENQIAYQFLGQQLGGRPKDSTCYDLDASWKKDGQHPKANFSKIMKREWFVQGIDELIKQMEKGRMAIMCSEEIPLQCHRHELIAQYLRQAYPEIEVLHIRGNGILESAAEIFEAKEGSKPTQLSLF